MHRTRVDEETDIYIDNRGYVLENLAQFEKINSKLNLSGIRITSHGQTKFERWENNRREKPWVAEYVR